MLNRVVRSAALSAGRVRRTAAAIAIALAAGATLGAPVASAQAGAEGSMQGKVVMITGSTDGLGRELARRVAALGAHVIVHGRNEDRGKAVVDEIAAGGQGSARFYRADLASLAEVRALAQAILRDYDRLDVLVNNAGIWIQGERQVSADGHELHFAVNYLSGFLLTRTVLPLIVRSAPARIVNVASLAQSPIDFDDLMLERPGRAGQAYGHSKLAQVLFAMDLADELKDRRVIVTALHPATLMDTSMVRQVGMPARSSVNDGADAAMRQIVGQDVESGAYYNSLQPARANAQAYDAAARARLREVSLALAGLDP